MKFQNIQGTEILELPAVVTPDGKVTIFPQAFMNLDETARKEMAVAMGGDLIYPKVRATYTMPESLFCTFKECSQLADKDNDKGRCATHSGK